MTPKEFESLLDKVVEKLGQEIRESDSFHAPLTFQNRVFEVMEAIANSQDIRIRPSFHPHAFPDIVANGFGVEVKSTRKDSWLSVGNSIFEGMRDPSVSKIYVVFGKMGGMPSVQWGRYEERITHVRISHAPRFVIEMDKESPLFRKMDVAYEKFATLQPVEKMRHIRQYSRGRLKPGERLWWLEDEDDHGLPLEVKLYMRLSQKEKVKLRAEGAILFPQIVSGSRDREKYNDVAFFFLKHRNVFCPQTRDLYSAGSVAGTARGGNYLQRALSKIEKPMLEAANRLEDEVFEEYWEEIVPRENRIIRWLELADGLAKNWRPSKHLFLRQQRENGLL